VAMEGTHHELKILLSNLKVKRDDLDHVKLSEYIKLAENQVTYTAGEIILYDSYRRIGLILESMPDHLRILNPSNTFENVKLTEVSKKVINK
jgi:hypothetical protein